MLSNVPNNKLLLILPVVPHSCQQRGCSAKLWVQPCLGHRELPAITNTASQKAGYGWGGAISAISALFALPELSSPPCWPGCCARLEQAASSSWPSYSPEMTQQDRACELLLGRNPGTAWAEPADPCLQEGSLGGFERQEGKGDWSGSAELRNSSEMLMPSSDAPAL